MIKMPKPDDLAHMAAPPDMLYRVTGDERLQNLTQTRELFAKYFFQTAPNMFILYHAYYYGYVPQTQYEGVVYTSEKALGGHKLVTKPMLLVTGVPFALDFVKEPSWWSDRSSAEQE